MILVDRNSPYGSQETKLLAEPLLLLLLMLTMMMMVVMIKNWVMKLVLVESGVMVLVERVKKITITIVIVLKDVKLV